MLNLIGFGKQNIIACKPFINWRFCPIWSQYTLSKLSILCFDWFFKKHHHSLLGKFAIICLKIPGHSIRKGIKRLRLAKLFDFAISIKLSNFSWILHRFNRLLLKFTCLLQCSWKSWSVKPANVLKIRLILFPSSFWFLLNVYFNLQWIIDMFFHIFNFCLPCFDPINGTNVLQIDLRIDFLPEISLGNSLVQSFLVHSLHGILGSLSLRLRWSQALLVKLWWNWESKLL